MKGIPLGDALQRTALDKVDQTIETAKTSFLKAKTQTNTIVIPGIINYLLAFKILELISKAFVLYTVIINRTFFAALDAVLWIFRNRLSKYIYDRVFAYNNPRRGITVGGYTMTIDPCVAEVFSLGIHHFIMKDETPFEVTLYNYTPNRCNCTLKMEGKNMGTFRMEPWKKYTIRRPVYEDARFIFVREEDEKGEKYDAKGIISVIIDPEFRPEKDRKEGQTRSKKRLHDEEQKYEKAVHASSEVIYLYGKSYQYVGRVKEKIQVDYSKRVILTGKLVSSRI